MRKLSVKTGMSRPPQAKKVAPPAVPLDSFRHSGSSFGSAGYISAEDPIVNFDGSGGTTTFSQLLPPGTPGTLSIRDDQSDYGSTISKSPGSSNNSIVTSNTFTFPVPRGETLTHKAAVYYHQQLALQEDQGIDLQSPLQGRDSPGSSGSAGSGSRHSTASLDSGKASSYLTSSSHRGGSSIGSGGGGLSGTSPRCSVSSCSISEHDVISEWLMELHFEEYALLFSQAGYDLATISRMTPEDLTAIGIKKPHHREKIKQHIDNLQLPDQLPNFVPGSIEEWLRLLRLDEYIQHLLAQGYKSVVDVTQITWEDLEDIGIVRLGHQKKILLAIKRVKDIINGKWVPSNFLQYQQHIIPQLRQPRGKSLESLEDNIEHQQLINSNSQFTIATQQQQRLIENTAIINQSAAAATSYYHPQYGMPFRSFDDGDITPTNEMAIAMQHQGGTLPRQHRQRPIAKVVGTSQPLPNVAVDYNKFDKTAALKQYVAAAAHKICVGGVGFGVGCKSINMPHQQPPDPPKRLITTGPVAINNTQMPDLPCIPGQFDSLTVAAQQSHLNQNARCYPVLPQFHTAYYTLPHQQQMSPAAQFLHNVSNSNQPIYANYAGQIQQTTVEVHAEKTQDSKSNSSIDSIDLPFANENLGTIRTNRTMNNRNEQQQQQNHTSLSSSSSSSSAASAGSVTTTIASGQETNLDDSNTDVLNDIGNMLANLTDELDAMLEEEKKILNEDDDLR